MLKLTKTMIDKQTPVTGKQLILRDDELPGLAIRVSGRSRSWVVEKRVMGQNRRIVIGHYPEMPPEQARAEAEKILRDISFGIDPIQQCHFQKCIALTLRSRVQ